MHRSCTTRHLLPVWAIALLLSTCGGCAWFKGTDKDLASETIATNEAAVVRAKRGAISLDSAFGGITSESQQIEKNLGIGR
ncbi:MAG: hypothetical protein SGJ20_16630 [Planctomycetota bacterium]|nr:hypothetical protein [Planctomycetota bacterium]